MVEATSDVVPHILSAIHDGRSRVGRRGCHCHLSSRWRCEVEHNKCWGCVWMGIGNKRIIIMPFVSPIIYLLIYLEFSEFVSLYFGYAMLRLGWLFEPLDY